MGTEVKTEMTILGVLLVWLVCGFVFGYVIWDDRRTIDNLPALDTIDTSPTIPQDRFAQVRTAYERRLLQRAMPRMLAQTFTRYGDYELPRFSREDE